VFLPWFKTDLLLDQPTEKTSEIMLISRYDCVSVNTAIAGICLNFAGRDGRPKKFDWLAGEKAAREERLDARGSGQKTSIARLEYQP
jgi:hypothetical protein